MSKCPYCHNTDKQSKAGKTDVGSQRWRCKPCNRRYTPEPKQMYSDEMRYQAIKLYVDGASFRQVARHFEIDHVTVMNWVKAHAAQLPPALEPGASISFSVRACPCILNSIAHSFLLSSLDLTACFCASSLRLAALSLLLYTSLMPRHLPSASFRLTQSLLGSDLLRHRLSPWTDLLRLLALLAL